MIAYDQQSRPYNVEGETDSYYYLVCQKTGARISIARAAFNASGFALGF